MDKDMGDFRGIKALVVGLGDTGLSCVRWLHRHGAIVRGTDTRLAPPHAAHLEQAYPDIPLSLGHLAPDDFAWADLLVVSPGIAVSTPEVRQAVAAGKDLTGDVELFARAIRGRGKIIAITGSNGKSTVTSLTGHLCQAGGKRTIVAGNIGLPVLDALEQVEREGTWPDVWVLELSSFQLETTQSLEPDASTVLNLSQDHMDRYVSMEDYASAKARVFHGKGIQLLNRDDPLVMKMAHPDRVLWTFGLNTGFHAGEWGITERGHERWLAEGTTPLLPINSLPIAGLHNALNALAALALCRAIELPYPHLLEALETFKGLPHRVEKVADIDGISYYDDSKGTNVGATVAALNGFTQPVVLIAGGDGKGQDFSPLADAVKQARGVVLIGRDAPVIEAAIAGQVPIWHAGSLEEAVSVATDLAVAGDAVLLSPACASFDMFRNYVHRAEVFIAAVHQLGSGGHVS